MKEIQTFKEYLNREVNERYKKVSIDLGMGKKGNYFIEKIGFDASGNWSYMVTKGSNRAKKIQHQGNWGSKITVDTMYDLDKRTVKEIIEYYEEYLNESRI